MEKTDSGAEARGQRQHRNLPFLSRVLLFPLHLIAAFLHSVTRPLGIEPAVSLLITGGFFALALVPIVFYSAVFYLLEWSVSGYKEGSLNLASYLGIPLAVCYIVQVLLLDQDHLSVERAAPIPPSNTIERAAHKFYNAGQDYNPITCIPWSTNAKLSPSKQYVFAVHPHGIHCLPLSLFTTYGSDFDAKFPGLVGRRITGLAATVMFKIPMVREIFIGWGYCDASRAVASKVLECGRSVLVCTGGEEESMYTRRGRDVVVLQKRKGFIRLALSYGADIVPVFGVGNSDTYKTYSFMGKQRMWLQKNVDIALPIFHGRFFTPLPYKIPVQTLIGEPIRTPMPKARGQRPDEALVDEYHAKYIAALRELHAKHVTDRVLEIR
eukprot:CAMPEP_0178685790 /NCGR_PEP_ID=MMETSP0699-20121125/3578_1 /TAXON_ID=265572 /ORGANISM="Extubocellulus spinifer, Strain CCMP396" /LENGTH=380 /DNA_ID=CAMNT_0020330581 /DNA_START=171 /DNA_END=1313 /DNA_ORIENTATION=+